MNTVKLGKNHPKMIAHRGLSGLETENTNSAFVAAGNRSFYGIETDIHITSDKKFIIIHDSETSRVCETSLNVEENNLTELKKLHLNNICKYDKYGICKGDVRSDLLIPTLAEYIGICRKYEKKSIIELKGLFKEQNIKDLIDEITSLNYIENAVFISFSLNNLILLRKFLKETQIQYLVCSYNTEVKKAMNKYNLDLDIDYRALGKGVSNTNRFKQANFSQYCVKLLVNTESIHYVVFLVLT